MSGIQIRRLSAGDRGAVAAWDEFVLRCPEATFFHRAGWQSVLRESFGYETYFLYAERDGEFVGVLPLAQVKSLLFGHALVGLPFASYGGVAAAEDGARDLLVAEAVRLAHSLRVGHLELRNSVKRQDWPTQELYVAFRMPIPTVLDDRMMAIPQKRRNMVRKAIKLGLRAVHDDGIDRFFPAFAHNARDHGTPTLPRHYFAALLSTFGADCGIVSICNPAGDRVSSIMCFVHREQVLAYYAGETPEARDTAANDLKYWEVMKWARARGCSVFDIGRSKKGTGSYEFKRLWGFEPVQLYYQYLLARRTTVPQNNPLNPRYRMLIKAWKQLPLPIANRIGPMIVGGLG